MKTLQKRGLPIMHRGGVLIFSIIFALSLIFTSCADPNNTNSGDSNNDNNSNITDTNTGNNTNIGNGNANNSNSNSNDDNSNGNNDDNSNDDNNDNSNDNNNDNSNDNNSNGNDDNEKPNPDNPSPILPEDEGENPITKTIKLIDYDDSDYYLEFKADGTAQYINIHNDEKEIEMEFAYTYNADKKTIDMKLEKRYFDSPLVGEEGQFLTYNEIRSNINEKITVEKIRQSTKKYYEEVKDKEWFKEDYPDCNSYEDYEKASITGFESFADYVEYGKQLYEKLYEAYFGAQITYAYEIEDEKITLIEKFTGVKNLLFSECSFSGEIISATDETISSLGISCSYAYLGFDGGDYIGYLEPDKKTFSFEFGKDKEKLTATYTENINAETVTIKLNGKEYVCKFEGKDFFQTE